MKMYRGFASQKTIENIASHDYVLTPGRYIDPEMAKDDGVPFGEKYAGLLDQLNSQF